MKTGIRIMDSAGAVILTSARTEKPVVVIRINVLYFEEDEVTTAEKSKLKVTKLFMKNGFTVTVKESMQEILNQWAGISEIKEGA